MSDYSKEDQELIDSVNAAYDAMSGATKLSCWFGLGYASWLTIPRVLMEAMPDEWQGRAAKLLNEFNDEFPDWCDRQYYVTCKVAGKYAPLPDALCNYRRPDVDFVSSLRTAPTQVEAA